MLTRITLGAVLSILIAWVSAASATDFYVKTDGADTAAGTTWSLALKTISNAVAKAAASGGGVVTVSNGAYAVSAGISVTAGIVIRSYRNGSVDRAGTVVYGDGSLAVPVITLNHAAAKLEGFTVTNGTARGIVLSNGVVTNCIIAHNKLGGTTYGAGLSMSAGAVADCIISNNSQIGTGRAGGAEILGGTMSRCEIVKNTSAKAAGGIYMTAGTLRNCAISYNTASSGTGGGLYSNQDTPIIEHCRLIGNTCTTFGGGVYAAKGGRYRNCLLAGNKTGANGTGGGISGAGANPLVLESCTIAHNEAPGTSGGVNFGGTGVNVGAATNCIVYDNVNALTPNVSGPQYCFYSCSPDLTHGVNHNITNAPMFVAANTLNYRLLAASKCINAGVSQSWMNVAFDLGGLTRRMGGEVDLGAYETPPPPPPAETIILLR